MTAILVDKIVPNPEQPRKYFNEVEMEALAQSIQENTLLTPITVEKAGDEYVLIDGERRWRAAKMLGWNKIEANIRPASNHNGRERLLQALVANVQRSGNTPLEEARAYQKLLEIFRTQTAVAQKVGVSVATIGLRLSLLELEPEVQRLVEMGQLALDTKMVSALKNLPGELQKKVAHAAATRGMAARSIMAYCSRILVNSSPAYNPKRRNKAEKKTAGHFDALAMVENTVPENLGIKVRDTCAACPLYEEAGEKNCRQCPLVDFLRRLEGEE